MLREESSKTLHNLNQIPYLKKKKKNDKDLAKWLLQALKSLKRTCKIIFVFWEKILFFFSVSNAQKP